MKEAEEIYLKAENILAFLDNNQRDLLRTLAICDGSYEKLKQLMIDPELYHKTIFDFDFSNPDDPLDKYHKLVAFNGLQQGSIDYDAVSSFETHPVLMLIWNPNQKNVARDWMKKSFHIRKLNDYGLD
jgi:hypothetical protein